MIQNMKLIDAILVLDDLSDLNWEEMTGFTDYKDRANDVELLATDFFKRPGVKYTTFNRKGIPSIISGVDFGEHEKIGHYWWQAAKVATHRQWLETYKFWLKAFPTILTADGIHRIEAQAIGEDHGVAKYFDKLGFCFETTQEKKGRNGETARIYSKIWR